MDVHDQAVDSTNPVTAPALRRTPVDIMIPTYNERVNLPHAIASVIGWANKVFVLDSGSADGTRELAEQMGAVVVVHPWEGYARQKNWGLANLPFESPWVFILDADEAITPKLRDEIIDICSRPVDDVREVGFYVNRYLVFMGKRIRHCGYFPSWNLRLFKRGKARYEDRRVHEHMILDGPDGYLRGLMAHEDRRGLEYYIAKHNRYSTLEAETMFYGERNGNAIAPILFGNEIQRRRYFRTKIYPKLPARWLGRFIWMYFFQLGFLDGLVGLRFCLLISTHELLAALKLRELQRLSRQKRGESEPPQAEILQVPMRAHQTPNRTTDAEPPVEMPAADHHREAYGRYVAEPERSPWTFRQNVRRVLWMFTRALLFRLSFHNWYAWRRVLLRLFGAKLGRDVRIRPTARIEMPWNLEIGDGTVVGDHAILYSLGKITLGRRVVVSQYAHLCAGTHDFTRRTFPLLRPPISVGDEAWIAADAFVGPGIVIGDRAVVGARATVTKDVPPDQVVAGNPARVVKRRELTD